MREAIRRALQGCAVATYRRPVLSLTLGLVVAVAGVAGLWRLGFDSDIMLLLPADRDSVAGLRRYRASSGGLGAHVVLVRSPDAGANRRFVAAVVAELAKEPSVDRVAVGDPKAYFEARALYYSTISDLRKLALQIRELLSYHRRKKNPFFVDLDDRPRIDLPRKDAARGKGRAWRDRYEARGGQIAAIVVWPRGLPSDMVFASAFVKTVAERAEQARRGIGAERLIVSHHGSYFENVHDYQQIESDIVIAPALSLALLLVLLVAALRSARAIICAVVPLVIAILAALGLAWLFVGRLNSLSAFAASVLLGLGIDFSLHWLLDYRERKRGLSGEQAVGDVARERGYPVLVSALTTAAAFFSLCLADNRGFREFGLIAGIGVLVCLAATLLLLPPMIRLLSPPARAPRAERIGVPTLGSRRVAATVVIVGVVVGGAGLALLLQDRDLFEYRMVAYSNLYSRDYRAAERAMAEVFPQSFSPIVVLCRSLDARQEQRVRRALAPLHRRGASFELLSAWQVIPRRQLQKQRLLSTIASDLRQLQRLGSGSLDARTKRRVARGMRLASARPFALAELPHWLRRLLRLPRGERALLIYSSLALSDGRVAAELRAALLPLEDASTTLTGETIIFAELLEGMKRDGMLCLIAALLAMIALLRLSYRRWRDLLLVLTPVALGMLGTVVVARLLGVRFGLFNLVALPLIIGIGVDDNIHLTDEIARRHDVASAVRRLRWPIIFATATTLCGFLGFNISGNPGLRSVGVLGAIGFCVTLVATLLVYPALATAVGEATVESEDRA